MKNPLKHFDEIIEETIMEFLYEKGLTPEINSVEGNEVFHKGMGVYASHSPDETSNWVEIEDATVSITVFDPIQKKNIDKYISQSEVDAFAQDGWEPVSVEWVDTKFEEDYTAMEDVHHAIAEWVIEEREDEELEDKQEAVKKAA